MTSSEGWIWKEPLPIQRVAPLTLCPAPSTTTSRNIEPASRIGVARRIAPSPCRAVKCMTTRPIAPTISVRCR
ncbi:MAG: hypothetical protein BGO11_08750 [Solirubrobacterales bacterium 70-9]|nr:MAG: hypothetical protein BGO11_08750 [Solirubrobacterales bacterium 70-9]